MFDRILNKTANGLYAWLDEFLARPFNTFPFGMRPLATADEYLALWERAKAKTFPEIDAIEERTGFTVDKDWLDRLALITQIVKKDEELCYQHGRILYSLLRAYGQEHQPEHISIIETGTARGFSSVCMAKALQDSSRCGRIFTFDVLPHEVSMYWNCVADVDGARSRAELLKDYKDLLQNHIVFIQGDSCRNLKRVSLPRVHMAFLDGMHTYDFLMREFAFVDKRQEAGDLIVFDDYTPAEFPGVVRAVDEIGAKHGYEIEVITLSDQRGYAIGRKA